MIDTFSMMQRVISRLEKFTFDRVWNEPYAEYRTNTRPKILNRTVRVSAGSNSTTREEYQPTAGVLSGEFEQIALPSTDAYYVYSIEKEQFRPIKFDATDWVALSEYCNLNRVEIRVYSDTGVFLWRGGIFIRKYDEDTILLAVDANMLHRCLDTYTTQDGSLVVTKRADPSSIFFTKYVDSDVSVIETAQGTFSRLNKGDNRITCTKLSSSDALLARRGSLNVIPESSTVAFYNGHIILSSGDYASQFTKGGYIESIYDEDVIYDGYLERGSSTLPVYSVNDKRRVLFHIPKSVNPNNYLVTYNSCDIYLIPKNLTDSKVNGGFDAMLAGVLVHMCDREANFHQITHNDFSVDLELLDSVASENGFDISDYFIHYVVRHHDKKRGIARDANYCDILYCSRHSDKNIVDILLGDHSYSEYNLDFWTAAHLEQNSVYAKAMMSRVGSTVKGPTTFRYRPTIDRTYKAGKIYYQLNSDSTWTPVSGSVGSAIPEGVVEYIPGHAFDPTDTTPGETASSSVLEQLESDTVEVSSYNQCQYCKLYTECSKRKTSPYSEKVQDKKCPLFAYRGINEFIAIYGYFNTLQLICRRVTTYRVTKGKELNTSHDDWEPTSETMADDPSVVICNPTYSETELSFPVRIPLALFDLNYDEWIPIVYLNGVKLPRTSVTITGKVTTDPEGLGLIESFWSYTPGFDDDIFFDTDQYKLNVKVTDPSIVIKPNDFVTIELIPKPSGSSAVSEYSKQFTIDETEDKFVSASQPIKYAFWPIGSKFTVSRKNSELVYLNGKQLVAGIDYMPFSARSSGSFEPIVQNVSYLQEDTNNLDIMTVSDTVIGSTKGFILGNEINWDGVAPFWFDNMSVLSVGGKVVSNFTYENSRLVLADGIHENGEPYMVRTSVPQTIISMIANDAAKDADTLRLQTIRNYFDLISTDLPYRAVLPYSHKIYSTYLLKIITDVLDGTKTFDMIYVTDSFIDQFSEYESLKQNDIVYNRTHGLSLNDLRFVDVYPLYHNLTINSSTWRKKINFLVSNLLPSDDIRHREHINGK